MPLGTQIVWLLVLSIPIACVAWTVTHEEVFREPREFCERRSLRARSVVARKFYYLFTCEYCFSHYVAALALWLTGFRLLLDGWRGVVLAWFALVWVANLHMSIYAHVKVSIKNERADVELKEEELSEK